MEKIPGPKGKREILRIQKRYFGTKTLINQNH